jgi:anaphase-promoting complex subunit 2
LENIENNLQTQENLNQVYNDLLSLNLFEDVMKLIYHEIENYLLYRTVPDFWKLFTQDFKDSNKLAVKKCNFQIFRQAVAQLYQHYRRIHKILERAKYLNEKSNGKFSYKFDEVFKSSLLSQLPVNFDDIAHDFYEMALKVFLISKETYEDEDDDMEEKQDCRGCENHLFSCKCQEIVDAFSETNLCLSRMSLLDKISGHALTNLIQDKISNHIEEKCQGNFDSPHLKNLEIWLETIIMEWLIRIYNNGSSKIDSSNTKIVDSVHYFKLKLKYFLYEKYANKIIDQFFNIIIEFPDSIPAIDDLKLCMEKLDLRTHLVETLRATIENRLLHPGVDTGDIITGYVTTIKAMRHLEKSGILLQTVTEPVKEYLRKGRTDTVRSVVTSLIEESPSDLSEELARSEAIKAEETERNSDEMNNWEVWNPDPIDADPEKHSANNKKLDIISMIVDIYGSKELFVNEYRTLLADRLLSQLDFTPEKEIRNLELLKLRFGDELLHKCEVMLKDLSDSKRINSHIQSAAFTDGKIITF